ncbi:MAG: RES family NAD+ phosphorylase [Rhizomicrobium sp.]
MMDEPATPEFASWKSYQEFARRVRRERRYATDPASRAFIQTVLATAPVRDLTINKGLILYRAQLDVEERVFQDDDGAERIEIVGHALDRMMPNSEKVQAGRANPSGIAYLYLASQKLTAVSEVRPWLGAGVSVAQFEVRRDVRALDLTKGHEQFGFGLLTMEQLMGEASVDRDTKRRAVWTDIDSAFSRPVSRSEETYDYVPTQILAEAFRETGYEGIVYRSSFGDPGYNIVLFDVHDAEICSCAPYTINKLSVEFEQSGNDWFASTK